jgi:hypothetical protein
MVKIMRILGYGALIYILFASYIGLITSVIEKGSPIISAIDKGSPGAVQSFFGPEIIVITIIIVSAIGLVFSAHWLENKEKQKTRKHRFNSKPILPVESDTKVTGKALPVYSEGKEEISI